MFLVADNLGIIAFEVAVIGGRKVVLGVYIINRGCPVKVFIGTKTVTDNHLLTEFFLGHTTDSISARFVLEHRSTGYELLAFRGLVLPFPEEHAAVVFDHEID